MMTSEITILPDFSLIALACFAIISLALALYALRAGLRGWALRLMALLLVLIALLNPQFQQEDREGKTNIVFVAVDKSSSQMIADRMAQTQTALQSIRAQIADWSNFELREMVFTQDQTQRDTGTKILSLLKDHASDVEPARISGAFILSDGRIHDNTALRDFPAPVHHLQTGHNSDWDWRLNLLNAPGFAIVDEPFMIKLRIDAQGNLPPNAPSQTKFTITLDGAPLDRFEVPLNRDVEIPLTLRHAGQNILKFHFDAPSDELTTHNNSAVLQINGVRDRLRVLLVSGEPHAGGRTWRNLLKSDPTVDLVHFTILRSPEKSGNVPADELSLIAFPTNQLFLEKINEFDLIIFDRYKRRGLLTQPYLESIVKYVENGGAILVSSGEYFAGAESLFRTSLGKILPVKPNAQIIEKGFYPRLSELGLRHPVTQGLSDSAQIDPDNPPWGRWYKLVVAEAPRGDVIMSGAEDHPLLVLDRAKEGRVAMLLSDQAWLWSRGAEGGGPQQELLRRLAHWLMQEPELEEERLSTQITGNTVLVTRQSLHDRVDVLQIENAQDGKTQDLEMTQIKPGLWQGEFTGAENSVYHLQQGDVQTMVALSPTQPLEFSQVIATPDILAPLREQTGGGLMALEATPNPALRIVRPDRPTYGANWLGVVDQRAYNVIALRQTPFLPAWAYLILAALLAIAAWWLEGRQKNQNPPLEKQKPQLI